MKKILIMAVAMLGFATAASAQTFDVGTNNLTLTAGFSNGYGVPIALSYERGILDFGGNGDHKLGVGGFLGFGSSNLFLAAESNYHYVGVNKLDLYGGVRLGYRTYTGKDGHGGLFTSFDIGANYFFNDAWGINGEIGTGMEGICLGVTHRF